MVHRQTAKKELAPVYDVIHASLSRHSARVHAGINHEIHDKRRAHDGTPVYDSGAALELYSTIIYPDDRVDAELEVTVYNKELTGHTFDATLGDFHAPDDKGQKKYRKRVDKYLPVYNPPESIGYIERRRGTQVWAGAVWIPPQAISDMLVLLNSKESLYVVVDEVKNGRYRSIRRISLQTNHPDE